MENGQLSPLDGDVIEEGRVLDARAAVELTERLTVALDAGGLGTFQWDRASGAVDWDARLEAIFGYTPGTFPGTYEAWYERLHPDDRPGVLDALEEAIRARRPYRIEHRVVWPDGGVHWVAGAGNVTTGPDGEVTGCIGCTADVTERVVAEQERARLTLQAIAAAEQERISRERLEFLGRINEVLSGASDRRTLMRHVVEAAVPRLCDWCVIDLLPERGSGPPDVEIAHADPAMVDYAYRLLEQFPYDPDATSGVPHVIRTGRSEFHPIITEDVLDELDAAEDARDVVRHLALRSAMAVPIIRRGVVLGAMQFVMSSSGRLYTSDDLALAEAVAGRIASSVANLALLAEQRSIATTLQASLLPDTLPDIPGVDIAVRYWATGAGVEVGGDFYDLFPITDQSWAVVVGDVCGKGPAAAAVTGMVRHTIASAAWHGHAPVAVLEDLHRVMTRRASDTFCTVAYGTLDKSASGFRLTLACGGHPLPILVRQDGGVSTCGEPGTLVGLLDAVLFAETTTDLEPGDSLVLYTDGAVDLPSPHHLADADFRAIVAEACRNASTAKDSAERIYSALAAILPIDQRTDDIALLVLRITPS